VWVGGLDDVTMEPYYIQNVLMNKSKNVLISHFTV
jgi:hypothetical protein